MKQTAAQPSTGRVLLRTQNGSSGPYRVFNYVFAGVIALVVALAIFYNPNTFLQTQWWGLLAATAVGCGVFLLVNLIFSKVSAGNNWIEPLVASLLFIALVTAQLYVGWELRIDIGASPWDFDEVYLAAQDYVLHDMLPGTYFQDFPGNIGLYSLLCLWFGAFHQMGVQDFTLVSIVLNILCIDLAILFLYLSARLLMGKGKALFILVAAVLTVPFLLYMPILYTDTVSLPFPIAVVYLWLRARQCWRKGDTGGTMGRFIWLSVLAAAGGLIKMTVLIVYIAILIDLMLMLVGSARWLVLLAGAASFAVIFFGGGWLLRHSGLLPTYNYDNGIPFTHWIMMGLTGDGGYNNDDYNATLASAATKAGRSAFAMEQIGERLADFGFGGTAAHAADKLRYTWGDATYYVASKLDHMKVQQYSPLYAYVVPTGARFAWLAYGAFAVHGAMLVGMLAGSVKSVLRKNDALTFVRIAVFGLLLFLLIWETRSRYLVNYLPLMLLVAMEALPMARPRPRKAAKDAKKPDDTKPTPDKISPNEEAGQPAVQADTDAPPATPDEPQSEAAQDQPAPGLFEEAEAPDQPDQPGNLFDQPKKTKVVNTIHTEIFDVPTGDPFYEMAHTASWEVRQVLEEDETSAGTAQPTEEEPPAPQAPTGNEPPPPSQEVADLFTLIDEATPALPQDEAPTEEASAAEDSADTPAPDAEKAAPNLNDAFTRAAFSAMEPGQNTGEEEPDLFARDAGETGGPAPLPPAGRTPQDLAAEDEQQEEAPLPQLPGQGEAQLDSLWDFDD